MKRTFHWGQRGGRSQTTGPGFLKQGDCKQLGYFRERSEEHGSATFWKDGRSHARTTGSGRAGAVSKSTVNSISSIACVIGRFNQTISLVIEGPFGHRQ